MSRKTTPSSPRKASSKRTSRSTQPKRSGSSKTTTGKTKSKRTGSKADTGAGSAKAGKAASASGAKSEKPKKAATGTGKAAKATKSATATSQGKSTSTAKARGGRSTRSPGAPVDLLTRAELDIAQAVESLNSQMTTALNAITELAISQRGRGEAVVRTAPLDRATATFQRLVAEVVDDHLGEMLGPLIGLRHELAQRGAAAPEGDGHANFWPRAVETLDQVLALAHVHAYGPKAGQPFDPLIHLAVGETHRDDLDEGAVAETLQPGFRSDRGKVVAPAKVKVNRR